LILRGASGVTSLHSRTRGALGMLSAATLALFAGIGRTVATESEVMQELVPTGKLRVGVPFAPAPTPIFVAKDARGEVHGVPLDLGTALARALGVPSQIVVVATTGDLTDALSSGAVDVGFMPEDAERRSRVDFGSAYFVIESTYLVLGSDIKTLDDVDRPEVTVVGIAGSTTMRAATRSLKTAKVVPAKSVDEAVDLMRSGTSQAFALSRDGLLTLQKTLPGSRILDGGFQTTGVAVAVQKNRAAALAYVTRFIEDAKANGIVRRAFNDAGLQALPIAPPEPP
jgi:polar amino acid transport system substrate-binding protein